jgi:predicted HAD superfamily Cof-like phosphohydrolase
MGHPTAIFTANFDGLKVETGKTDWIADIAEMHTKFGFNLVIRTFDSEKLHTFLKFRIDFLEEELNEIKLAFEEGGENAADDVVDGLIDLCVVAIGTLNAFDVDAYEAWNRVHGKNMQKEVGIKENRPNPLGMPDLIKPHGWTSPTHADNVGLLARVF